MRNAIMPFWQSGPLNRFEKLSDRVIQECFDEDCCLMTHHAASICATVPPTGTRVHQNEKAPTKAASISMAASNLPGAPLHCFGQYEGRDRRVGLALCQQMSRVGDGPFLGVLRYLRTSLRSSTTVSVRQELGRYLMIYA